MENILEIARRSENLVIAISKNTQLRIQDKSITALLEQNSEPCLLDVDKRIRSQFPAYPIQFLGEFSLENWLDQVSLFRIDVDRKISREDSVTGIKQLTGTE